jgi:hypothetical protein
MAAAITAYIGFSQRIETGIFPRALIEVMLNACPTGIHATVRAVSSRSIRRHFNQ